MINTHLEINNSLCGDAKLIEEGKSRVTMTLTKEMKADEKGLIHGGFIFGLADYAAMVAVNHPNVVLASSSCKFLKPSVVGDNLVAQAKIESVEKNRYNILVDVTSDDSKIFSGEFLAVIPKKHVLD